MDAVTKRMDLARYEAVRAHSDFLAAELSPEDQCVQSMPDASPAKWHRAHTTWFFEQFILIPHASGYRRFNDAFAYLFNSYYEALGPRQPRPLRGLITRPTTDSITAYRAHVDAAMRQLIASDGDRLFDLIELGLQHEQQHQELLVTDITHAFAQNPMTPAAISSWRPPKSPQGPANFVEFAGGRVEIGNDRSGFHFDNEAPRHEVLIKDFALADRLVRNQDMLDFINDGGYRTPTLWMSDGWATAQEAGWTTPLYWRQRDGAWFSFSPAGEQTLDPAAPLCHVSWYEADALARWSGARLPSEAEWESCAGDPRLFGMTGVVWQWTESAYRPYPGFHPVAGAIGEYNGKFMINQMVLRGSSAATPAGHARPSYRNFFHPDKRWQFSGLRLARDL